MRRSVLEPVVLSDDERETLERWARRPKSAQALALRCRIVLECAKGGHNIEVAERLGIGRDTVGKWRRRFLADRLDGLHDEPRPGAPRPIDDDDVETVIVKTLEETPDDATHWSTRSMAKATGMSQSAVSAGSGGPSGSSPTWSRPSSSAPTRSSSRRCATSWASTSTHPRAPWCSASTRRPRSRPSIAPRRCCRCVPGCPSGAPTTTSASGTTNLYAALDVASGQVIADMTERHRAVEFRRFLNLINRSVPEDLDVHLVVDNVSTHKTPEIKRGSLRHPRFHLHFTPTYSSWINLVERWFAELTTKWLRRGTHRSTKELEVGHHRLDRSLERRPQAVRLAQERRRDPRHRWLATARGSLTQVTRRSWPLALNRAQMFTWIQCRRPTMPRPTMASTSPTRSSVRDRSISS